MWRVVRTLNTGPGPTRSHHTLHDVPVSAEPLRIVGFEVASNDVRVSGSARVVRARAESTVADEQEADDEDDQNERRCSSDCPRGSQSHDCQLTLVGLDNERLFTPLYGHVLCGAVTVMQHRANHSLSSRVTVEHRGNSAVHPRDLNAHAYVDSHFRFDQSITADRIHRSASLQGPRSAGN